VSSDVGECILVRRSSKCVSGVSLGEDGVVSVSRVSLGEDGVVSVLVECLLVKKVW
jgi:hypothetical protein